MLRRLVPMALVSAAALSAAPASAVLILKADDPTTIQVTSDGGSQRVVMRRIAAGDGDSAVVVSGSGAAAEAGAEEQVATYQTADGGTVVVRTIGGGAAAPQVSSFQTADGTVVNVSATGGGTAHAMAFSGNNADGQPVVIRMGAAAGGEPGSPYIGVLLAPVSDALAAHVGEGGLMISNLVVGSPAEAAGLRRFDIIRGINGEALKDVTAVTDAVKQAGVGGRVELRVLRAGAERTIALAPAPRPAEPGRYVHEGDPQDVLTTARPIVRGHSLRVGPDGAIQWENLGALNDMLVLRPFADLDGLKDTKEILRRLEEVVIANDPGGVTDVTSSHSFAINVSRNGESLSVRSGDDGRVVVERVDASGAKTVTEYDNADRLREADPEAYDVAKDALEPQAGAAGSNQLLARRAEWQAIVERHLSELAAQRHGVMKDWLTLEREAAGAPQLRAAIERLRSRMGDTAEQLAAARELIERTREVEIEATPHGGGRESTFDATVHADGRITIISRSSDGEVREEFANEDDLKARDSALFERFMRSRPRR